MLTSLTDAITITGATSGSVIAQQSVSVGPLTAPQKTALVAFITSLGISVPPANITTVNLFRQPGVPGNILVSLSGLVQPASAAAALTNRTQYDDIVGVVP